MKFLVAKLISVEKPAKIFMQCLSGLLIFRLLSVKGLISVRYNTLKLNVSTNFNAAKADFTSHA